MNRTPLAVVSIVSVQLGAAVATHLFGRVGAPATVLLRQGLAAAVLAAVTRPRLRGRLPEEWRTIVALGAVLATMNLSFYGAVERLPLGIAVAIELVGPLALSASLSRTARQLWCVALAAIGVAILGIGGSAGRLDALGVVFALAAAGGWACYILLNRSLGRSSAGAGGLTLSLSMAAVLTAPVALPTAGAELLSPSVLAVGLAVAMLSAAIPFSLEMHALRTVDARTFGVVMSTSPAIAAMIGFVLLDQQLDAVHVAAIGCIGAATAATTVAARPSRHPAPA